MYSSNVKSLRIKKLLVFLLKVEEVVRVCTFSLTILQIEDDHDGMQQ